MITKRQLRSVEIAAAIFDPVRHQPRCFVACFCWHKNTLLTVGINSNKTNPTNLKNPLFCRRSGKFIYKPGTCAELNALNRIKNKTNIDYGSLDLINVRIDRQGYLGLARPCVSCESLMRWARPKSIFYTGNFTLAVKDFINNPTINIFQEYIPNEIS